MGLGKMVTCTDLESTNGKMDPNMKEAMSMEKNKETESFIMLLAKNI